MVRVIRNETARSQASLWWLHCIALSIAIAFAVPAVAQAPAGTDAVGAPMAEADLAKLVGPIALYPDDLVAIILPASTSPVQLVQADRFLEKRKADPKLPIDDKWDDAVKSLLNYPSVVKMMSADLDWTTALGEAVVTDQGAVIEAVQVFRRKAKAAGSLKSDEKQVVKLENEIVVIQPGRSAGDLRAAVQPDHRSSAKRAARLLPDTVSLLLLPVSARSRARNRRHLGRGDWRRMERQPVRLLQRRQHQRQSEHEHQHQQRQPRRRSGRQHGLEVEQAAGAGEQVRGGHRCSKCARRRRARCCGRRGCGGCGRCRGGGCRWRGPCFRAANECRTRGRERRRRCSRRLQLRAADPGGQLPWRLEPQFDVERRDLFPERRCVGIAFERGRRCVPRWWRWRSPMKPEPAPMHTRTSVETKVKLMTARLWSFVRRAALALLLAVPLSTSAASQQTFATPEAAVDALMAALKADSDADMIAIFGEEHKGLIVQSDRAATSATRARALAAAQTLRVLREAGPDRRVLVIGDEAWPMPIPIVRVGDRWRFATDEGAEEIVNRRIGGNERNAIYVLRAYIDAQRQYAARDRDSDGVLQYAQKLASTPGKHDGLYWPTDAAKDEELSPFGPLIAEAGAHLKVGSGNPYRGYYFRILTRQGPNAPGGAYSYLINGRMIAGFALVAYPAEYGNSGVMTFIVNQNGKVYQKDLGAKSMELGSGMTTFDPGRGWTEVPR